MKLKYLVLIIFVKVLFYMTPLMIAVDKGKLEITECLLSLSKINVNATNISYYTLFNIIYYHFFPYSF